MPTLGSNTLLRDAALGFVAGVIAVLLFHQIMVFILSLIGMTASTPYSMRPVPPFGVPTILNQMFWGGLWGVVFALIVDRLPRTWPLWAVGILFGWLGPMMVTWFVMAPIRGNPVAAGWVPSRMLVTALIAGSFGLGVALIFTLLRSRFSGTRSPLRI